MYEMLNAHFLTLVIISGSIMIPQFLVPYANFFHVLALLNYLKFERLHP